MRSTYAGVAFGDRAWTEEWAWWGARAGQLHTPGFTSGRLRRSSVVSAVGARAAIAGYWFPPRLEPSGSNTGGGSTRDYLHERRRPDSNRGIKALQASALPLGYGA